MTYMDLKKKHQTRVDAFPMAFAFSTEQVNEGLAKLGITKEEAVSIGGGGFIKKDDVDAFNTLFKEMMDEKTEACKDAAFLVDGLRYELENHEYSYTWDDEPAIDCFKRYVDTDSEYFKQCLAAAKKQCAANQEDGDEES